MSREAERCQELPTRADLDVRIGYPVTRTDAEPLALGPGARLRSGTVLYDGTTIGRCLQTGHGVVIREACTIGDDVSVWSNSVIDYGCRIGNRVKIHCNCYVAQHTELEDDVFLAPGVTIANDLYPGDLALGEDGLPESPARRKLHWRPGGHLLRGTVGRVLRGRLRRRRRERN